ncbi:MAG: BamA/TamA family outer membrane protein [Bernardetiaceae bacterium]
MSASRVHVRDRFCCGFLLLFLLGQSACIPVRPLKAGENYLYRQEIKGVKGEQAEALASFVQQQPNRRFPLLPALPYVYFYLWGKKMYDKKYPDPVQRDSLIAFKQALTQRQYTQKIKRYSEETKRGRKKRQRLLDQQNRKIDQLEKRKTGNWLMRAVGEPPVIFDPQKAHQSCQQMRYYLQQEGYFSAQIDTSTQQRGRRIYLDYHIQKGDHHRFRNIRYQITDTVIQKIVLADTLQRLFQPDERYSESHLTQERERLFGLLRNSGYFGFSKEFIFFEIDTNTNTQPPALDVLILIEGEHPRYRLQAVRFISDQQRDTSRVAESYHEGIFFRRYTKKYSTKVLSHRIQLRPNDLYRHADGVATQRSLAALNIFKFVNMRYDTLGSNFISNIYVSSYPKYNLSLEGGVNVTQQAIPGPFATLSFQNRNLFEGCELLTLQFRFLLEAQPNFGGIESNNIYAQEYNLNGVLTIPKFFFPFSDQLNRGFGRYNPQTKIQVSYTQTNRVLYNRLNTQFLLGYGWNNNKNSSYEVNLFDMNIVLTPEIAPLFQGYLDSLALVGNPLNQSFRSSVLRSTAFSYRYNNNPYGDQSDSYFLKATFEQGGTLIQRVLFDTPGIGDVLGRLVKSDSLADYNYLRADLDLRRVIRLNSSSNLALRGRIGLAFPYGAEAGTGVLPYEKYFFMGGGNSLRAWQPRRLGPGGFRPTNRGERSHIFDYPFEQPGELLLEANMEWRKDLFSVAELALFLDAGNVWILQPDSRPDVRFAAHTFWRQIALGTGFGLRLDFSFFIIRGDLGIKLYDPAAQAGYHWLWRDFSFSQPLGRPGQAVFNLAIGYPF